MKKITIIAAAIVVTFIVTGCPSLRPTVYAAYYVENLPDSNATVQVGTSNSQANAIHAALNKAATADGQPAEANAVDKTAKSSGLFVNNAAGDRTADLDATAALEILKNVRGTSAGQSQTTTKGDESPATGEQTQTPTQTENRTTNLPISVGQAAASETTTPAAE
jgi:hypothetical protein